MAKPIRATPTLKGKEAVSFIRSVLREEKNPSKKRKDLVREALKLKFYLA